MAPNENYFEILGVEDNAGYDVIERRYRQVRKENEGNPARLRLIDEAYRTLINPFKRENYLKQIRKNQGAAGGASERPAAPSLGGGRKNPAEQIVESPSTGMGKPVGGSRSKTQIVGSSSSMTASTPEPKAEPGQQGGKSRSKTQIVGGGSAIPSKGPEPKAEPGLQGGKSRSKTQIVGGGSSLPASTPEPKAETGAQGGKSRSKTQVVGSGQAPVKPKQEPVPQKATPAEPAPAKKRQGTVILGQESPPAAEPDKKRKGTVIIGQETAGGVEQPVPSTPSRGKTGEMPPVSQPGGEVQASQNQNIQGESLNSAPVMPVERSVTTPMPGDGTAIKHPREITRPEMEQVQIWEAVVEYQGKTESFRLSPGENLVGRPPLEGPRPVVALLDPEKFIGRTHATLIVNEDGVFIRDNKSANGTSLNDEKLAPEQPYSIHEGDVIWIEGRKITIRQVRRA